ncbi:MAG TPA: hypothetical protein VES19_14850 [Candidatus Limnocylindrales bacterium]|nr:hypothetical protein [Candidatus Limnocylindrales bacterium]
MLGLRVMALLAGGIPAFGGEDPLAPAPNGDNWHHEGLTRRAAQRAGWSVDAENALAFHADYVDSYLYNPLWWLPPPDGGIGRLRVVMSSQADLVRVHFDDLFAPEAVRAMWRRYLSGTVCGLLWIARQDLPADVKASMAHNVVGVSLHALQDFWTHSNWIDDPARRPHTWFEVAPADRAGYSLWTGSYELPDHLGIKPHGKYQFACAVVNGLGGVGRGLLRVACHAASPLASSEICLALAACDDTQAINPPVVLGVDPPDDILFMQAGINVDNHWMAEVGAAERAIGLSGTEAFDLAYGLALRTSCQWLHILGHVMEDAGLSAFWTDVRTRGISIDRYVTDIAPWERLDQIPYRFISSGAYPPVLDPPDTGQWFLRLAVATADVANAGTNADLVAFVDGVRVEPLDQGPKPAGTDVDALLGLDDHERGTTTAYYLGPFATLPHTVGILNDAPDGIDVVVAAGRAVLNAVVGFFGAVAGFFLGLVGAAADYVGQAHAVLSAADLEALAPGGIRAFALRCNGGTEGIYVVYGRVEATPVTGTDANGIPWRDYWVRIDDLLCEKESEWDRFTPSDEPFVVGVVLPHGAGSSPVAWRTEPFGDVDTAERRTIGRVFSARVARRFGFLSVAVAVYESDDESPGDRDRLMTTFAGQASAAGAPAEKQFGVVLAEAAAAAWRPQRIDAAAFQRGTTAQVVSFAAFDPGRWVEGGERLDWTLAQVATQAVAVPDTITCGCVLDCGETAVPPPRPDPWPPRERLPRVPRPPRGPKAPLKLLGPGRDGPRGRSKAVEDARRERGAGEPREPGEGHA